MKELIRWFEQYYPYSDNEPYQKAMGEIKGVIKDQGVLEAKRQIKAVWSGLKLCKLYDGSYELSQGCFPVYVNFKPSFVSLDEYYATTLEGHIRSPFYYRDHLSFVTADQPIYNGYPLSLWVKYGKECEDCGALFLSEGREVYCPACVQQSQPLSYNTRVEDSLGFEELPKKKNLLGREETTDTLFGVELEYEGVNARQVYKTLKGHALPKSDGTIKSGVEVVTRPACVQTHKKSLKAFYDQVKVSAAPNTGMHVHIDKRKLSQYQLGFMLQFLNAPSLTEQLEKIAGRKYSSNSYCKRQDNIKMTTGLSYDEYDKRLKRTKTNKYVPLNTSKSYTAEVRIFSSPKTHEEMSAKLDFVNALVKYSSPYAVSVKSLADKFQWETFIDFIQTNKKDFPDFVSFYLKG